MMWLNCALDCEQVWRELFMRFMSYFICTVMIRSWGILFVDAGNAFNSVNHVAALWNARSH